MCGSMVVSRFGFQCKLRMTKLSQVSALAIATQHSIFSLAVTARLVSIPSRMINPKQHRR